MKHSIPGRQVYAWLAVAISAPLAHFSGLGWLAVLLAAGAMLPLTLLFPEGWQKLGKIVSALEMAWLVPVLGELLRFSGAYWPSSKNEVVVPLVLLALAALSGSGEKAARAGAVLFWALILMYAPVLLAGAATVEYEWLDGRAESWKAGLLMALLLPSLAGLWCADGKGRISATVSYGLFALLLSVLNQGVLSGPVAAAQETAFYEAGRTLRLGGITRLEPMVSVAVTFGWYALASFLISTGVRLGSRLKIPERVSIWVLAVSVGAYIVLGLSTPGIALITGCIAAWILVPMLHAGNFQKSKK